MKKKYISLIIIVTLILIISCVFLTSNSSKNKANSLNNISITQYKAGTSFELKNIDINNDTDKKKLRNYVKKIKALTSDEMVQLELLNEIEIQYNDYITIGIQLKEKNYCYYTNTKENISSLAKMPKGLYEWVEKKMK